MENLYVERKSNHSASVIKLIPVVVKKLFTRYILKESVKSIGKVHMDTFLSCLPLKTQKQQEKN